MNVIVQSGVGISETHEELKQKQQAEENEARIKLEEKKYSQEFSNSKKNDIEEKLGQIDDNLITTKEKKEIVSKMEAIYINTQTKGLSYDTDEQLAKVIKTSSFKIDGNPNDYSGYEEYNKKIKEIRDKIMSQINKNNSIQIGNGKIDLNLEKTENSLNKTTKKLEPLIDEQNKKIEENPIFPIIDRLNDQGKISEETINEIGEYLSGNDKLDLDKIKSITPDEKNEIEGYITNLNENNQEQNRLELTKDIKQIDFLKGEKTDDSGNFESEVLNKIGGNYLKFPDKQGSFDVEKDLETAIVKTRNDILKQVKNIKKGSETYNQAIININSSDIRKKMEGINSLYILAYSNEGILGKTTIEKYKNSRKQTLIKEGGKIEQKIKEQNISKEQKIQLEKRKEEIKTELSEITGIKDGKKIKSGDIFKPTKQDINDTLKEKEPTK